MRKFELLYFLSGPRNVLWECDRILLSNTVNIENVVAVKALRRLDLRQFVLKPSQNNPWNAFDDGAFGTFPELPPATMSRQQFQPPGSTVSQQEDITMLESQLLSTRAFRALPSSALVRRLARFATLKDADMQALVNAIGPAERLSPDQDNLVEGDPVRGCAVVLDGLLCSYKIMPGGKRQILAFLIAGDTFGLSATILGHSDHSVAAVIPSRIATIPQPRLRDLFSSCPGIQQALWQDMLVQNAISREWIANVGQRNAYQRISHLLCEMRVRFEAAGLAEGGRFPWPITQAGIGDAAGLSIVHVNRTLQRMRAEGLITIQDGEVTIHDQEELEDAAGFDSAYLYLDINNRKAGIPLYMR